MKVAKVAGLSIAMLAGIIVLAAVALTVFFRQIATAAVEAAGPRFLGATVAIEGVSFRPLTGRLAMEGVIVGNPEGFKTRSALEVGTCRLVLKTSSLFTKRIVVESLVIDRPTVTYELGLRGSNIGALMDHVNAASGKPAAEPTKVVIDDVWITGTRVRVSSTLLQGVALPVPVPPIHLTDIGKDTGGASFAEATKKILGTLTTAVADTVEGAGNLAGEGVNAVRSAAASAGQTVAGAASSAGKAVGDVASAAGRTAGEDVSRVFGGLKRAVGGDGK